MSRRFDATPLAVLLVLLAAVSAPAQNDEGAAGAAALTPDGGGAASEPVHRLTAHRLAELARSLLAQPQPDHPDRVAAVRTLLTHATELDPENAQLLRLQLEALRLAEGAADQRRATLRRYLSLRPADNVAQLKFIGMLAERTQTVEQRLQLYERLLSGGRAEQLSASLRSRIAMRAAALHRQRGETAAYGERLKQAIRLDSTNRRACAAAFSLLQRRNASTVDLAQALLNLIAADPADGDLHHELAAMLLDCGQYEPAVAWYTSASQLWRYQGYPGPGRMTDAVRGWGLALWADDRPDSAIRLIRSFVTPGNGGAAGGQRNAPAQPNAGQAGAGDSNASDAGQAAPDEASDQNDAAQPTEPQGGNAEAQAPPAEADRQVQGDSGALPASLQMILVAILQDQQRPQEADAAFDRLVSTILPPDQREDPAADRLADFVWAHLLFDRGIDQLGPRMDRLEEALGADDPLVARLQGWYALRRGDAERARQLLQNRAEQGDFVAQYGLVLLETNGGGEQGEKARYDRLNKIYNVVPDTLIGVLAARRIQELGEARPQASEACLTVARLAGQLPNELRRIADQPARFVTLEADVQQTRLEYAQPLRVKLNLTNVAPMPLALGPDGTIPTTVVIQPRITIGGRSGPVLDPHVVDLDRRLRLQSGESLEVVTRIDLGPIADVLRKNPVPEIRLRLAATLNPRLGRGSEYRPGLLGLRVPAGRVTRTGSQNSGDAVQRYLQAVRTAEPAEAMRTAALLLQIVPTLPENRGAQVQTIAEELNGRFEATDPAGRAWLLSHLPVGEQHRQPFVPMVDAAVNADTALPLEAMLATDADRPEATVLNAALRRPDGEPARRFAEHIKAIRQLIAEAEEESSGSGPSEGAGAASDGGSDGGG